MAEVTSTVQGLSHPTEYVELPPLVVKEHLLRLFNNQIQKDYMVADFVTLDGNVVVKLKQRTPRK